MESKRILILLILWLPLSLAAQRQPRPAALTTEDGLGFRDIRAIVQDPRGLMWIGTTQGLERYDGLHFFRYGNDAQSGLPFPGSSVSDKNMLLVNDTSLWVVADEVLYAMNLRTQKTVNLSATAGLTGKVYNLRQAKDGTIWVVTDDGREQQLLRHKGKQRFQKVATARHLRMPFSDVAFDRQGNAWWSTNAEGLRLFSPDGNLLHAAKPDSIDWYGARIYFTNIATDNQGRLFVFTKSKNEIGLYHPETGQYEVLAGNLPARVFTMLEDTRGNRWFSTFDGLLHWSPGGEWTDLTATLHGGLQFTSIRQLYEDRTHLLWIATDNGLLRFPIGSNLFRNHLTIPGAAWGNAMRGIFADAQGNVYAHCETGQQGLHKLEESRQKERLLFPISGSPELELIFNNVYHFVFDEKENIAWTLNNNLLKIDLADRQISVYDTFDAESGKSSRSPFCLLKEGKFILGNSLENLTLYDPVRRQRNRFLSQGGNGIPSTRVEVILEDRDGRIWIGTASEGLFCFNRKGETLAHFSTKTKPALNNDRVLAVHVDQTGKLWAGAFGGGLCRIDFPGGNLSGSAIKIFTREEGLCDNNVVSIEEDEEGNIWAGTYNGLACYRVSESVFRNFFEADGLSSNEFNYASSFKDQHGGLWFGGMNGINYFNPKDIPQAEKNPPLCLTEFAKYNKQTDSTLVQVIGNYPIGRFVISPFDSWFQFSWALPNYFKPDKNHFYVRLEGLENDWSYIGNTPFVRYNKLPAGDYILRVKGSDSQGNWSETELAVPITVKPFFYETGWFFLLVLALFGGVGYWIARRRHVRLLELERMRTRISSDLHDEVGSMLTGLSMQVELLEMNAPEKDRPRIHHIGDISRTAVSKMRDLVWSIDSRRDKVKNLLERMQEQATELLQPKDITCHFELGVLPMEKKLPVDLRQHLYLIFKEALTNIVRHSKATAVTVRFGNFREQFEMSIHDNGTSDKDDPVSTGLGLSNMALRAEKISAKLSVENSEGFTVKLTRKPL